MKFTLAAVGSRGDVQPMFALARALLGRGHRVHVAAPPNFAAWAARLGHPFTALGGDTQGWLAANPRYLTGNPLTMLRGMRAFFREQLPLQFEGLLAAARDSDAMVCAGLAFAAPSVAEYLRMPAQIVAYTPCVIPGRAFPPPMVPWQNLPPWLNLLLWELSNRAGERMIGEPLNLGRERLGLARIGVFEHLGMRTPWLVAADREILPPSPEWRERVPYASFLYFDDARPLDPELEAWLAAGEPPLYIGFGSMSGGATARVDAVLKAALRASGRRVLIGAGWGGLGAGELPPGWRVVGDVPHARLFPRLAAVVHHGGSGTMAAALRAGVPQVVLPLILDQFHHAACLYRAGLAPRPRPLERISAGELRRAIDAALVLDPRPRQAAAARLAAADGAALVARHLEDRVTRGGDPAPFA